MIGKTLGHYEIVEKLGSGGMGEVYRALDTKLSRHVAIKVLSPEFSGDPDRRKRFAREAQAIAALKHPNIVTVYSVEEIDEMSFITMELVEGGTLAGRIPPGGLSLEAVFDYAIPLADAISCAHDEGITHRDLKPANIMFDKAGRLKVLDFGLAKLLHDAVDAERAETLIQASDTAMGQVLGTAAYMSPEQAEGKAVDHRSDIFSLGIVLYEMSTGRRPFHGDTPISTISSVLKDTPPSIVELNRTLPRHLGRIVHQCLEKDPDRRFQSAKDVRNGLEGLKKEIDTGQLTTGGAPGVVQPQVSVPGATFASDPGTGVSSPGASPPGVSSPGVSSPHVSSPGTPASGAPQAPRPWLPWVVAGAVVVALAASLWALRPDAPTRLADTDGASTETESATVERVTAEKTTPQSATHAATPVADQRKMTVVLPFENLGPPEDAYFAAGVAGEITSRLASVSGLGVISRTSATQYDRAGKTIRQIGEDLGVDYVLEGTVRWAKSGDGLGRVRITPQLIRVADDTNLWSQTYDREIDDIFQVQTEIAGRVIEQLDVTLLGSERERVAEVPTDNVEAYQLYLQARNLREPDWFEWDRRTVELLEGAARLDPRFIDAWALLSQHHSSWYAGPLGRTEERLSRARSALQRAEQIDPDHPWTQLARGSYQYYGFREYDRALEHFLAAMEQMPNEAQAREMVAYIYRRQGRWEEALDNLEAAFELDPRSRNIAANLAGTHRALRRFEDTLDALDRAMALDPESSELAWQKATTMVAWKGDVEAAERIIQAMPQDNMFWVDLARTVAALWRDDYPRALNLARQWEAASPAVRTWKLYLIAAVESLEGGLEAARPSLEASKTDLDERLRVSPNSEGLRRLRAQVLALLGEADVAVQEAKLAVDLSAKDRFSGPQSLDGLARVYALVGRHDEAIDLLEQLLGTVYEDAMTPHSLRVDGAFDLLQENPRFQKLLAADGS